MLKIPFVKIPGWLSRTAGGRGGNTSRDPAAVRQGHAPAAFLICDGPLRIQQSCQEDAAGWFRAVDGSRSHLRQWEAWPDAMRTVQHVRAILAQVDLNREAGLGYHFVIRDPLSDGLIGGVSISNVQRECNCANLGFWVQEDRTGRGIASWAAATVANFAFSALRITRLELVVRQGNAASCRVALKLGAQAEGLARARLYMDGASHGAEIYSLLPGEVKLQTL
jgi:ribosomal-protein-serine acetyltransferase